MSPTEAWRRMQRGAAGLSQFEIIFVVVLGIIILFSLVMAFRMGCGGGGGGRPDVLMYKCEKCAHEFEQETSKLPDLGPDVAHPPPLDCPDCGEKGGAFSMVVKGGVKPWRVAGEKRSAHASVYPGPPGASMVQLLVAAFLLRFIRRWLSLRR